MNVERFKKEAEEWLSPLGYTLHFFSSDYTMLSFSNTDEPFSPGIKCTYNDGDPSVKLIATGFKMTFYLSTNEMMFKHPEISRFITVARHYQMLAEKYPPF